jgi:hypothetical protein
MTTTPRILPTGDRKGQAKRGSPLVFSTPRSRTPSKKDVLTAGGVDRVLRDLAAEQEAQPERLEAQRRDVHAELSRVEGRLAKLAGRPELGRQVLRKLLVDAIVVVPEADGTWTYSATLTLHRAMGGIRAVRPGRSASARPSTTWTVRSKRCSGAR